MMGCFFSRVCLQINSFYNLPVGNVSNLLQWGLSSTGGEASLDVQVGSNALVLEMVLYRVLVCIV